MLLRLSQAQSGVPHGYCYLWNSELISLHAVSDTLIAAAYTTIPITLGYFVFRRRDLPFSWMFVCFGVFILACGLTHALAVYNLVALGRGEGGDRSGVAPDRLSPRASGAEGAGDSQPVPAAGGERGAQCGGAAA